MCTFSDFSRKPFTVAFALALLIAAWPAANAVAQNQPGASTGGVNVPSAEDVPGAEPPAPDAPADQPPPAPPKVNPITHEVTPRTPEPTKEGEGNAQPGQPGRSEPIGPLVAPPADIVPNEMPDDDTPVVPPTPEDSEQPTQDIPAAPAEQAPQVQPVSPPPAPGPEPALPANGAEIPLWKPGTAAAKPAAPTPAEDLAATQKKNVVLLVDQSASMGGYWAWARDDAVAMIRSLSDEQNFHLILFGRASDIWEVEGDGLDAATLERKIQAIELLTFASPAGDTDPQAGFRRAMQVIGDQPATIIFISDGIFNHPMKARRDLRSMVRGQSVIVNTHLYGDAYPAAVSAMKSLARDGNGEYVNATQYP